MTINYKLNQGKHWIVIASMAIKSLAFDRPNSRDIIIFYVIFRFYRRVDEIAVNGIE